LNPQPPSDAVSETKTFILEDLTSSVLSQLKKYHPSRNLNFNDLGIFRSLKLNISVKKILPISLNLNFTPFTLGCCGLMKKNDFKIEKAKVNMHTTLEGFVCIPKGER